MFFENGFRIADRQAVIRKVFRTAAGPRVFAETGLEHIPIMIILQYEANRPHIVHLIPNAMKTEMLVLFALALLGTAEKATAQAADKKAARKEKKELRQSIDRARHQQALDAILDSAFVLQANAVLLENYPREQVDFHRDEVPVQVDLPRPAKNGRSRISAACSARNAEPPSTGNKRSTRPSGRRRTNRPCRTC